MLRSIIGGLRDIVMTSFGAAALAGSVVAFFTIPMFGLAGGLIIGAFTAFAFRFLVQVISMNAGDRLNFDHVALPTLSALASPVGPLLAVNFAFKAGPTVPLWLSVFSHVAWLVLGTCFALGFIIWLVGNLFFNK